MHYMVIFDPQSLQRWVMTPVDAGGSRLLQVGEVTLDFIITGSNLVSGTKSTLFVHDRKQLQLLQTAYQPKGPVVLMQNIVNGLALRPQQSLSLQPLRKTLLGWNFVNYTCIVRCVISFDFLKTSKPSNPISDISELLTHVCKGLILFLILTPPPQKKNFICYNYIFILASRPYL